MTAKTVPDWVREARIEHFEANLAIVDPIKAINHCIDRLAEWEDIYDELRTDIIPTKSKQIFKIWFFNCFGPKYF